jgi:hypothetical protein
MNADLNKIRILSIVLLWLSAIGTAAAQEVCGMQITSTQMQLMDDFSKMRNMGLTEIQAMPVIREVAISAHIIRRSDGSGGIPEQDIADAIAIANTYFTSSYLEFFLFTTTYIDNDDYYDFVSSDEAMMGSDNDIPNTINIYFANSVGNGAGAFYCGYAYFPGGPDRILMDNECTPNGTVLTHELGHYFTLYHTHGKINGVLTDEFVNGSNCATAGDELCDTPADPQLSYNNVNASCIYTGNTTDANGDTFVPDPTNVMSYSRDECRSALSNEQFARMDDAYDAFRSYLLVSNEFSISTNVSPLAWGSVTGDGIYAYGDNVELVATANPEYKFVSWTENGVIVSIQSTYNFIITEDRSLTANFALVDYTITTNINPGNGGSVIGAGIFNYGENVQLVATPELGFSFFNWTENGVQVSNQPTYNFTASEDRILIANFQLIDYTISVDVNPLFSGAFSGDGIYNYGDVAELIATPEPNYRFVDWTENNSIISTLAIYSFTVIGDRNLVANFELDEYSVSLDTNPVESGIVNGDGTYMNETQVQVAAAPQQGYIFVNWTEDNIEVSDQSNFTFNISSDRVLVANFQLIDYLVTSSVSPSLAGIVLGSGTYSYGDLVDLAAVSESGYQFLNWSEDGVMVSTEEFYSFILSEDRNLVANFELIDYVIETSSFPAEGGTISAEGTYNYDSIVHFVATPNLGYTFSNWTEDDIELSSIPELNVTVKKNRNIVANFDLIEYNITVDVDPLGAGEIIGARTYNYNEVATLKAVPNTDFGFLNWIENGEEVSSDLEYSFTVTGDRFLTAQFLEPLGIFDAKNQKINSYPNPVQTTFNISIDEEYSDYDITDLSGRVYNPRVQVVPNYLIIDFSGLNPGIYLVTLRLSDSIKFIKVFKE